MLSEAVLAHYDYKVEKDRKKRDKKRQEELGLSVSGISTCPYATYIGYRGMDRQSREAVELMRMEDGWYQEAQAVERLERAGVKVYDRQNRIYMGKSRVPGSFDGKVDLKRET